MLPVPLLHLVVEERDPIVSLVEHHLEPGKLNITFFGGRSTRVSAGLYVVRKRHPLARLLRRRQRHWSCRQDVRALQEQHVGVRERVQQVARDALGHERVLRVVVPPHLDENVLVPRARHLLQNLIHEERGLVQRVVEGAARLTPRLKPACGHRSFCTQSCAIVVSDHRSPRSKNRLYSGMSECSPLSSSHTTVSSSASNACLSISDMSVDPLRAVDPSRMSCARFDPRRGAPAAASPAPSLIGPRCGVRPPHLVQREVEDERRGVVHVPRRPVGGGFSLRAAGLQLIHDLPREKWSTAVASRCSRVMSSHGTFTATSPLSSLTSTEFSWSTLPPTVSSVPHALQAPVHPVLPATAADTRYLCRESPRCRSAAP